MSPAPAKMNPFPGLRPFTQEEDYLFFGREEQTIELLQRLGSNRFVAVVGTSGSGKSSLVRCGLLSELLGGRMLGAGASWEIAVTHPGGNPLALLTDALLEADLYDRAEEHARENLLATLSRSHFGLVEAVRQADLGKGTNFLLVVDQFEEIFRFHEAGQTQQEAANEFVSLLLEAAAQKDVPIYVVLTMRSDFIGECGQFEGLAEMVNRGEFLIPRLTREQYKRVVEGPIKVAGGQIAPRLLQRLLNDLGQQADQLPCLQHALMRTWDVWSAKGETEALDLDDYQRVGKMSQALSLHADEIYESLTSDRQRELCKGMFQALTVEESNNRGIRRPQRLGRLCQILEVSAEELRPIVEAFRQSGVTFLMPSFEVALTDQTIIDISHESLMRVWTRLRQWVEEETQAAGIYHRLAESAALNQRGKAGLYRDPELGIALAWRETKRPNAAWAERYRPGFATAIAFLDASSWGADREEKEREAGRQRELERAQQLAESQARVARQFKRFAGALAVGLCLAVAMTIWAFMLRQEANEHRQHAEEKEKEAKVFGLVQLILSVDTPKAPAMIGQITEQDRQWSDPLLREVYDKAAEKSPQKLHASLALLPVDPSQVNYLFGRLLEADPREALPVIRDALAPHKNRLLDKLWTAVEKPEQGQESQRLRAAAALMTYVPESERWAKVQDAVVDDLLTVPAAQLTTWRDALRPLRGKWLAHLAVVYGNASRPAEQSRATDILADYAADEPKVLSDLLLDADEKQFAVIYPRFKEQGDRSVAALLAEIDKRAAGAEPAAAGSPAAGKDRMIFEAKGTIALNDAKVMTKSGSLCAKRFEAPLEAGKTYRLTMDSKDIDSYLVLRNKVGRELAFDDDGGGNLNSLLLYIPVKSDTYTVYAASLPSTVPDPRIKKTGSFVLKIVEIASGSESINAKLARQQTNGAVALLRMQHAEKVWPLLKHGPDPSVRSYLIHRLSPLGADAKAIVKQLDKEPDLTIRRALLLSLGEFTDKVYTLDERVALLPKLQEIYRKAADPGLHAASEWLLRQWKDDAWLKETDQAWAKDKQHQLKRLEEINEELKQATSSPEARWYVNGQGQTLVVIPGPAEFWMGSPPAEEGRLGGPAGPMELRHWQRIGRSFALASKKVSAEQFRRFRPNDPMYAPTNDCPATGVSWHDAAAYCNWLSEQEEIPKEQWCYEPEKLNFPQQAMKMAANYLQRTGYRLPTEAEWEFACRAGAATRFSFGESEELLPKYGWFANNSERKSQAVGSLKPNDLGLFDMHGNIWDQCQDVYKPYGKQGDGRALEELEDSLPSANNKARVIRGGGFFTPAAFLRSSQRSGTPPTARSTGIGFRPARTLPLASFNRYAASRAAAVAAAGQGKDQPLLDEAAKAKLRRQILNGLKAELTNWNKIQPPRLLLIRNLRHWQQDSALAGIRDEAALAKLPAAEQQAFSRLWADVAKMAEPANSAERLESVRAAVLAATGENKDEPPLDDVAKSKLRGESLAWLKAELSVAADRAGKANIVAAAAPLPGLLEKLAEFAPKDGPFQAELARHFADQGNTPLANATRTKARAWYESKLATDPENADLAADLADLLLLDTTRWTVLTPTNIKSEGGATLKVQPDGSVLASGVRPDRDVYTLEAEVQGPVLAVKLEALPDPTLPDKGPGRSDNGNFHLHNFRVTVTPGGALVWSRAYADFEQQGAWVRHAIDADLNTPWAIAPKFGEPHWGVFVASNSGPAFGKGRIMVRLDSGDKTWVGTTLGRFRLSVCGDSAFLKRDEYRVAVMKAADPWLKLGAAYAVAGQNDAAEKYFGKALGGADDYESKKAILEHAAHFDDLVPALAKRQLDDAQMQLALARKLAERGQKLLAEKQPAKALAELQKSREAFTRLRAKLQWTVPTPVEMKSTGGETLTVENDGSIFISGPNSDRAIYTLKLRTGLSTVTAIRLETIPDVRLPQGGAGRYDNGNFHLAEFTAAIVSGKPNGPSTALVISSAFADTQMDQNHTAKHSIDGNSETIWDTVHQVREPHWAVFGLKSPARMEDGFLRVTLDSGITSWGKHGLGRFRISVTNEAEVLKLAPLRQDLKESEVVDLNLAMAKAHAQQGQNTEAAAAFTRALALVKDGAGKARIITEAAPLKGMLENLAESVPHDGLFQAALARHFAERGKTPLANAARTKARALFEAKLAKEPENAATAFDLADLLLSAAGTGEYIWIDDAAPSGARLQGNTPWEWVSKPDHPVFRGHKAMRRQALGSSQHDFEGADSHLKLGHGAKLFAYVFLDPKDPPKTVMLQFNDGSNWEHRAFWGEDLLLWGTLGKESRMPMGPLPKAGEWVRLEVDAEQVGFRAGTELNGWSFLQHGGTCYWDAAGGTNCTNSFVSPWLTLASAYAVTGKYDRAVVYASKAIEGTGDHDAKKIIFDHLMGFDKIAESLAKRHPAEQQLQLIHARNLAVRGKKALASEKPAEAVAPLKQAQDIFTRLLAPREAWTMLKPVEKSTENGSRLELQKDGSIFVDQPAKKDSYTLVFETDLKGIKAMRLEALPDFRLPSGGPGWAWNGNFVLTQLSLRAAAAMNPNQQRFVGLRNATADFNQSLHGGWNVREAVDGKGRGWAVEPEFNKPHTAVFELAEEIGDGQVMRLTVRVRHQFDEKFLLGRFRLSFTTDAATLPATRIRWDLKESEVVDLSVALAKAHAQVGQSNETVAALAQGMALTKDRAAKFKIIATAATLAVAEKGKDAPNLDDAAKAKLRRQALDGLKAELIILTKQLGSAPSAIIVQTLNRWQKDPDLASIREAAALVKLSADEQAVFTQLWADVAALLKRAQETPK